MGIANASAGYVMDTHYANTFFRELSPAWLNYVAALNGAGPRDLSQSFRYLELGCGLGTSSVVHAAANPQGEFHACDFNTQHVESGTRLAALYGASNLVFHAKSFEELLTPALPDFDYVVLHGVYSWVGAAARAAITRILRERLKPGGVVHLSYNCYPGWAAEVPVRKLLEELASSVAGETAQRIEYAVREAKELAGLRYFRATPDALSALDAYARGSVNYLAHEFFNDTWEPFYSVDIAEQMAALGLAWVGSATLADNHPELSLEQAAQEQLGRFDSPRVRELAADFARNQRFRRDVFVRGAPKRRPEDIGRQLALTPVTTLGDPRALPRKVSVPRGELRFSDDFMRELGLALTAGVKPLGQLCGELARGAHSASEVTRNLVFLIAAGALVPAAEVFTPGTPLATATQPSDAAMRVLAHAVEHWTPCVLASRVLGHAVTVSPSEALALQLASAGNAREALPRQLLQEAQARGRSLAGSGDAAHATSSEQQATALAAAAHELLLPMLWRLGVVT